MKDSALKRAATEKRELAKTFAKKKVLSRKKIRSKW